MSSQLIDMNDVLKRDPADVLEWVRSIPEEERKTFGNANWWLGIAEGAAFRTFLPEYAQSGRPNLDWARVAYTVYDYLARRSNDFFTSYKFMYKWMLLKVRLINTLGSQPGDPLLDAQEIVEWFFDDLSMTPEEAREKAQAARSNLRAADIDQLLELRRLRGKIAIIGYLQQPAQLERYEDIQKWLELKGQLI